MFPATISLRHYGLAVSFHGLHKVAGCGRVVVACQPQKQLQQHRGQTRSFTNRASSYREQIAWLKKERRGSCFAGSNGCLAHPYPVSPIPSKYQLQRGETANRAVFLLELRRLVEMVAKGAPMQ